jgi:hypothetical protein
VVVPFFRRFQPRSDSSRPLDELSDTELGRLYRAVGQELDGNDDQDRAMQIDRMAAEVLRRHPKNSAYWYDRGMYAKWRGDWPASIEYNRTALDLIPVAKREQEPAAWNLGIAATAAHDWASARLGWSSFGIPIPAGAEDGSPIEADFGAAPVRLNAEPCFIGQQPVVLDGHTYQTEVVWGRRLCPTRIRIMNVPLPESGHRFGDIVLHDGDTIGTRRLGDQEIGVFNQIALWQRSVLPTLTVALEASGAEAVGDLLDRLDHAGLAGEDWTDNIQVLCRACSEGTPGSGDHHHDQDAAAWKTDRQVGLAGAPDDVQPVLDRWAAGGPGRTWSDLDIALP